MKCLGIPWCAGNAGNIRRNRPVTANAFKFQAFHVMLSRAQDAYDIYVCISSIIKCIKHYQAPVSGFKSLTLSL